MKLSGLSIFDGPVSFLLKGPPGHGKTIAGASFALGGPIHISYWDKKGPIELISYYSKMGEIGKKILSNIDYDVYGATNAGQYLEQVIKFGKDCRYFAVMTDSLTQMTSGAVNWSLSYRDDRKGKEKLKVIPDFDEYKVETSLVTQALDVYRTIPCHVIWTAHPVPSIKIEGSGSSIKITKTNPLVTYGSKVAGIVPGNFSEIYHFSKQGIWDAANAKNLTKYYCSTDAIGDEFAKSNLGLTGEFEITNGVFYTIWKEKIKQLKEEINNALAQQQAVDPSIAINPFATQLSNLTETTQQPQQERKWNPQKGGWE